MNIGLLYTPVSIYQMTRGALVLFVGVLSVVFLRRRLWLYQFSLLAFLFYWSDQPHLPFQMGVLDNCDGWRRFGRIEWFPH
jgi:hypothetical protein